MELTCTITHIGDLHEGVGKNGNPWKRQTIVVETLEEQYAKKIALQIWNDEVDKVEAFNLGETITFTYTIESREYNGKWYTDVRAFNIRGAQLTNAPVPPAKDNNDDDGLPF